MIEYEPIGIIHSPFKSVNGTPIQPKGAMGIKGSVEVYEEYVEGLEGIEDFSHIILIYHFHLSKKHDLKVVPYMNDKPIGVFATRAPSHPNPIGISTVKLVERDRNILYVENVDIIDGTPLLDIKPYVPAFDAYMEKTRIGWLENNIHKLKKARDDGRFLENK
ncbi:MAG: tRNA (N6-threonylcarbamoyladenosine(37)-N6)-methyltransferase TrmO [Thermoplasmata archaeon]|nr:tRNA (N6-threonylcarbamoyladenosine(37)-N6)-methyltransferase TrmO [Thermoplasmata archaeon]